MSPDIRRTRGCRPCRAPSRVAAPQGWYPGAQCPLWPPLPSLHSPSAELWMVGISPEIDQNISLSSFKTNTRYHLLRRSGDPHVLWKLTREDYRICTIKSCLLCVKVSVTRTAIVNCDAMLTLKLCWLATQPAVTRPLTIRSHDRINVLSYSRFTTTTRQLVWQHRHSEADLMRCQLSQGSSSLVTPSWHLEIGLSRQTGS